MSNNPQSSTERSDTSTQRSKNNIGNQQSDIVGKKVSIVIVNWNSKDYVAACLRSLEKHEAIEELQIIVIDGASFDGIELLLANEFPYVEYIQSLENIGFGRCNNLAVEKAKSDYLLLLNPDTEFQTPTIDRLIEWHQKLPQAGILCPRLILTDGSLQYSSVQAAPTPLNQAIGSSLLQKLLPKSKLWGTYPAYYRSEPTAVDAVSGAFMFMKTKLFKSVGGFNPAYFMYAEDMDLCLQVRRSGKLNYHIPDLEVTHHGGGSSQKQISTFSAVKIKEAIYKYFELNHSARKARTYRQYTRVSALARLTILTLTNKVSSPSFAKWKSISNWTTSTGKNKFQNTETDKKRGDIRLHK